MCEHFSAETHMQTLNKKNIYMKRTSILLLFLHKIIKFQALSMAMHTYFKKKTLKALIPSLKFTNFQGFQGPVGTLLNITK